MAKARPPERPASGAAGSSWACSLRGAPRPPRAGGARLRSGNAAHAGQARGCVRVGSAYGGAGLYD